MKFGVSAFAWTGNFRPSHTDLLWQAKEYGFTGFEIPLFKPEDLPIAVLREALEQTNLDCTVCGILPRGINPISPDAATRKRSRAHLAECVEASAEIGARVLAGPLLAPIGYLPGHRPSNDEWMWAAEALQSVGELLTAHSMLLTIEPVNRSETFFLRTAAEARELCDTVAHPRIAVTLDTFHANIEEKRIDSAIDLLGSRLRHVHMSENDRGVLGSGHIDFAAIMKALIRSGYDGYIVVEGFGFSAEPSTPGALWAEQNVSPEELAFKSLHFLEQLARL